MTLGYQHLYRKFDADSSDVHQFSVANQLPRLVKTTVLRSQLLVGAKYSNFTVEVRQRCPAPGQLLNKQTLTSLVFNLRSVRIR